MLLRAVFLTFIISLLTLTMLGVTMMIGKVLLFDRALAYVPSAYRAGLGALQQAFSTGTYVAPRGSGPECVSGDVPCSFYASETITLPPQTAPAPGSPCSSSSGNCALNLQEHYAVAESRLGVQIVLTIFDAYQHPILTRTKFLTVRTFAVAPYMSVIGERDGAVDDRSTSPEGENAGLLAGPAQAGTQIVVKYHDTTGTNPDVEKDSWATRGWSSGNAVSGGWSP